jgi:23S rRNA-/tRNA-specific pseudouridylate synthase
VQILYEDNHIIAVNKACGELVQSDISDERTLVDDMKDYLKQKYNKPGNVFVGLPHRLDRPTSGIVILAKTGKALERLNEFSHKETRLLKLTGLLSINALQSMPTLWNITCKKIRRKIKVSLMMYPHPGPNMHGCHTAMLQASSVTICLKSSYSPAGIIRSGSNWEHWDCG